MKVLNLNILPDDEYYWKKHPTYENAIKNQDCGLDIPMLDNIVVPGNEKAFTIDLGFKAEQDHGYMLVPRSSISKTSLRMANSIGIIDKSYRGKVMVKLDNISNDNYMLEKGKCYFQIVAFNGVLPKYNIVDILSNTRRGSGGFGSSTDF